MVFKDNYDGGTTQAPSAILVIVAGVGFVPVCGAMRRSHLIKG